MEIDRILKPGGIARIGPFIEERLPKNFEKSLMSVLRGSNIRFEENGEHWEEGPQLRLILRKDK